MKQHRKNKIRFLILLGMLGLISVVTLQFQCNKFGCAENVYSFELGIKAYPDKDSVNVGDTIWLEVNEPTNLKDIQTGSIIDYKNASNLGTAISFAKLISENSTDDKIASKFRYVLMYGNEIHRPDSIKYREYNFSELNGYYRFKLALIPTEKGIFKMFISNAANVYRKNDNCTKASFQINFKETNQHLYFNEIVLPGVTLPSGGGIYLFKVN